jgi:DNA processing protein
MLAMVPGIGPVRFQRLLELCGGPQRAWEASDFEMQAAGLERRSATALREMRASLTPEAAEAKLARLQLESLTLDDTDYPEPLRRISDPPPVLFVRGSFSAADSPAVAIVGTRRVSAYGRAVAERLAADLAAAGVTVVSGLAKGVDTVAHRAALDAGGRTIAVLGNGLDQVYPPENAGLAKRMVEPDRGAVVTEFAPGVPPDAVNFPRRNRIISGLSKAIVVVEAGQKSGALITADFALEQGRDVLAVPGSILSAGSIGSNTLLKEGATLVTGVEDILDAIGVQPAAARGAQALQGLPPGEQAVVNVLTAEPRHVDEIALAAARPAAEVGATLVILELRGLARQVGGATYVRA